MSTATSTIGRLMLGAALTGGAILGALALDQDTVHADTPQPAVQQPGGLLDRLDALPDRLAGHRQESTEPDEPVRDEPTPEPEPTDEPVREPEPSEPTAPPAADPIIEVPPSDVPPVVIDPVIVDPIVIDVPPIVVPPVAVPTPPPTAPADTTPAPSTPTTDTPPAPTLPASGPPVDLPAAPPPVAIAPIPADDPQPADNTPAHTATGGDLEVPPCAGKRPDPASDARGKTPATTAPAGSLPADDDGPLRDDCPHPSDTPDDLAQPSLKPPGATVLDLVASTGILLGHPEPDLLRAGRPHTHLPAGSPTRIDPRPA
ncbi:hypothetical protein [Micromonospora peucetia]|uniref:Uncharacterized protein n=1 Tax=Micromonospora peucetia TaxID=47871 RepID=A0ABZ1EK05_9ACTN|nr:hypothetical protein [Micromonospora peucetia]WSA34581.1 hypothetical protein OIE14_11305 [Micromonospora peucetia]